MAGKRRFDEDGLLDCAVELFWRRGIHSTSLPDLAAISGVQRGSLYHAYGGKDAILVKAIERYGVHWRQKAEEALKDSDPKRAMRGFLQSHYARMSDPTNPHGCMITGICMEPLDGHPEVLQAVQNHFRATESKLECYLTLSLEQGRLPKSRVPESLARFFLAISRSMAVMHKVYNGDLKVVTDVMEEALNVF